ncbi:unnamed protein product [Amoebophrya sp. A120]|nr:unnamed protein product [Amoebophrya sp. A120]|eukprot:GSA120T00016576001.1
MADTVEQQVSVPALDSQTQEEVNLFLRKTQETDVEPVLAAPKAAPFSDIVASMAAIPEQTAAESRKVEVAAGTTVAVPAKKDEEDSATEALRGSTSAGSSNPSSSSSAGASTATDASSSAAETETEGAGGKKGVDLKAFKNMLKSFADYKDPDTWSQVLNPNNKAYNPQLATLHKAIQWATQKTRTPKDKKKKEEEKAAAEKQAAGENSGSGSSAEEGEASSSSGNKKKSATTRASAATGTSSGAESTDGTEQLLMGKFAQHLMAAKGLTPANKGAANKGNNGSSADYHYGAAFFGKNGGSWGQHGKHHFGKNGGGHHPQGYNYNKGGKYYNSQYSQYQYGSAYQQQQASKGYGKQGKMNHYYNNQYNNQGKWGNTGATNGYYNAAGKDQNVTASYNKNGQTTTTYYRAGFVDAQAGEGQQAGNNAASYQKGGAASGSHLQSTAAPFHPNSGEQGGAAASGAPSEMLSPLPTSPFDMAGMPPFALPPMDPWTMSMMMAGLPPMGQDPAAWAAAAHSAAAPGGSPA